jgi:hypothetical protein
MDLAQRAGRPGVAAARVPVALVIALVLSVALWVIPGASLLLLPIHPYLTFVHEGWHALVAVATGGHVSQVHISTGNGGVTLLSGGATLLIASAGYVGSALSGAAFLALLPRPRALRVALLAQYLWLVAVGVLWDHDLNAWLYLIGFGVTLYVLAQKLREAWFAIAAGLLAIQLDLAILGDLRTLLLINTTPVGQVHNDALVAAQVSHLPALFWVLLWAAIDAALLIWSLRVALGYPTLRRLAPTRRP